MRLKKCLLVVLLHIVAVWVLAIIARGADSESLPVIAWNCIVFLLPSIIALGGFLFIMRPSDSGKWKGIAWLGALFVSGVFTVASSIAAIAVLIGSDLYFADRYVRLMSVKLEADPRFGAAHINDDLSRSYFLFPYHPVYVTLESPDDREALDRVLESVFTPAQVSLVVGDGERLRGMGYLLDAVPDDN